MPKGIYKRKAETPAAKMKTKARTRAAAKPTAKRTTAMKTKRKATKPKR